MMMRWSMMTLALVALGACSADKAVTPGPVQGGSVRYGELRVDSSVTALRLDVTGTLDSLAVGDQTGKGHFYASSVIGNHVLVLGAVALPGTVGFKAYTAQGQALDLHVGDAASASGAKVTGAATVVWK